MKYIFAIALLAATGSVLFDAPAIEDPAAAPVTVLAEAPRESRTPAEEDRAAVERAVGYYMDGWLTGNVESLRKAFHADAKLFSVRNDSLIQVTQAQWYARFSASPSKPTDGRRIGIVSTEIAGNVAQVKVTSSLPRGSFTDYLSLARFGGEWKIVNKTFHFEPAS